MCKAKIKVTLNKALLLNYFKNRSKHKIFLADKKTIIAHIRVNAFMRNKIRN
jgi:hypothetical protein